MKGSPEKRFRIKRSNSTEHSERVFNKKIRRKFLQKVLNPQPAVFDISGHPVASQGYFNGLLKDIKNEFVITLLSLCDKRVSICYGCTHELKYQVAIPAPPFDLVVLTKMRRDYYPDGKKCQPAPSNVYFHAVYNNPFFYTI